MGDHGYREENWDMTPRVRFADGPDYDGPLADFGVLQNGRVVQIHTQRKVIENYDIEGVEAMAAPRREVIQSQLEKLQAELHELDQFGDDEYEDGAVLVFDMQYGSMQAPYVYAAIKANGLWFVTGQSNMSYWRWDQLVNFWKNKVTSIMLLKADRQVFNRYPKAEVVEDERPVKKSVE